MSLKQFLSYFALYLCMVFVFHFGTSMASDGRLVKKSPIEIVSSQVPSKKTDISYAQTQGGDGVGGDTVRSIDSYTLGAGDEIQVIVYGEDALSKSYRVSDGGLISMPLIGDVDVRGKTVQQVSVQISEKLSEGFLNNPDVSIEVINFRPVYIMGEVRNPGSYPYVADMTILNAVVIAGGYTYRADKDDHDVMRKNGDASVVLEDEPETLKVLPGDIILVKERFF